MRNMGSVSRPAVGQTFEVELFQSEEAKTSCMYWTAREDWLGFWTHNPDFNGRYTRIIILTTQNLRWVGWDRTDIKRVHLSFSPCLLCPCLAVPCSQTQFFSQFSGFLHCGHCALSPLAPRKFHSDSRDIWAHGSSCPSALPVSASLGCAVVSLCTEPSFFTPFFHPPHPDCLPPLSCWPPEGSTPHCHECNLVGNKWTQQIMSGTGIQCGGKMFPEAP